MEAFLGAGVDRVLDASVVREGFAGVTSPGRLERVRSAPTVLLDAAHNPAGARALASYLVQTHPEGVTLVFGAMKDKAVEAMLRALAPAARAIVCTTAPTPRAMAAAELAALARSIGLDAAAVDDPAAAVDLAVESPRPVVAAGSIFLLGAIRERVRP